MQLRPLFSFLGSPVRHRSRLILACAALIAAPWPLAPSGAAGGTEVQVDLTGLRSSKGVVRACMTSQSKGFPNCDAAAGDYSIVVAAGPRVNLDFGLVAPGRYAIAVVHDENGNGKMDRALSLMPKEGYGFSRDAPVKFGPPSFKDAAFDVGPTPVHQSMRMRYML